MKVDGPVIARQPQQADDALRLAERIGADQMGALGKEFLRGEQARDFLLCRRVAEHRQSKGRLGDENLAAQKFETGAGGIGGALVVAGNDDAKAVPVHADLRRAQNMPGRMQGHVDAAEPQGLAIGQSLRRAGEVLAHAKPHDIQRLLCRQHRAMAGARVIGMAVGDDGARDRTRRIDMEIAGRATKPLGAVRQHVGGCQVFRRQAENLPQPI